MSETGETGGRRGFLKCMAWAGTGLVWTLAGGAPASGRVRTSCRSDGVPAAPPHAPSTEPCATEPAPYFTGRRS